MTVQNSGDDAPVPFGPVEAPRPGGGSEKGAHAIEPLTAREKEMLLLERKWFKYAGAKDAYIRERWDISPTRYFQILNHLVDREAAMIWDPITVARLRRFRDEHQRSRPVRRLAGTLSDI